jgi:hypothetical protein
MIDLDAIERRANAATAGPWAVYEKPDPWGYWTVQDADGKDVFDDGSAGGEYGPSCSIEDRDFLVAARTDVPALIARVRELETHLRIERENVAELEERLVLCQRTNDRMREQLGHKPPPWGMNK